MTAEGEDPAARSTREVAEKALARLGTLGVTDEPDLPPRPDAHGFLIAVESLALTLDDPRLRADALVALSLARKERGEEERAAELRGMARRSGADRAPEGKAPWIRSVLADGDAFPISLVANLGERPRVALLLGFAPRIVGSTCADNARELARDLLASEDALVATGAVHALAALDGLGRTEALAARQRLVGPALGAFALDALVKIGRAAGLDDPDTGDVGADALVRLARMRLAAEEGDVTLGRELYAPVSRAVLELRVKNRLAEATALFAHLLPVTAALNPLGSALLATLIENPLLEWGFASASHALEGFASAAQKLADRPRAFEALEQTTRFALRRIRNEDDAKKAVVLFPGVAACARVAPHLGDPKELIERVAACAREKLVKDSSFLGRRPPVQEYRALLACGEALGRGGDLSALQGAVSAISAAPSEHAPLLLDEALASSEEVESPETSLAVLSVARKRLEEAPVAEWLAELALRAGDLVGPKAVLARWRHAEERRVRARMAADLS